MSGELPPEIGRLSKLIKFQIQNSYLEGSIPERFFSFLFNLFSICEMNTLKFFNLGGNKLEGKIPTCIGNMERLIGIDFSNNNLRG